MDLVHKTITIYTHVFGKVEYVDGQPVVVKRVDVQQERPMGYKLVAQYIRAHPEMEGYKLMDVIRDKKTYTMTVEDFIQVANVKEEN